MSARMELHVALSMRLDAIVAHRLANAYRAEVLNEAADKQWAFAREHWIPTDDDSPSAARRKDHKFGAAERLIGLIDPAAPALMPRHINIIPKGAGFLVRWQLGEETNSVWRASRVGADALAAELRDKGAGQAGQGTAPRCENPKCGRPITQGAQWCSTWCHQASDAQAGKDTPTGETTQPAHATAPAPDRPCVCEETPHPTWCPASVPSAERITEIRKGIGGPLTPRELFCFKGVAGRNELHVTGARGGHWPLTDDLPGALLDVSQHLAAAVAVIERAGLAGQAGKVIPKDETTQPKPIAYAQRITETQLLLADPAERSRAAEWPWDMWCRICLIRPSSHRTEAHALEAADQHVALYHVTPVEAHAYLAAKQAGKDTVSSGESTQPAPDYCAAVAEALRLLESAPEAFNPTPSTNIAAAANVLRQAHELGGGK